MPQTFTHTTDWTTFNLEPPVKPMSYHNDTISADPKSFSDERIDIGFLSITNNTVKQVRMKR